MSELPKYVICDCQVEHINEWVEKGYRIHTIAFERGYTLMSLKADSKFENITNLKDVSPHEVDDYLAKGWRIADAFSKFVRVVKPSEV